MIINRIKGSMKATVQIINGRPNGMMVLEGLSTGAEAYEVWLDSEGKAETEVWADGYKVYYPGEGETGQKTVRLYTGPNVLDMSI